jgi:hypothetical protein
VSFTEYLCFKMDSTNIIDFDAASTAWKENKIRRGASYVYRCMALSRSGERCKNPIDKRYGCMPYDCYTVCKNHTRYTPIKYCQDSSSGTYEPSDPPK